MNWNLTTMWKTYAKKASLKLNALGRIAPLMIVTKNRIIMKSFVESQLAYCPLLWMFHSRGLNNEIICIYERALRITYHKSSSYGELLTKYRSVTIHHTDIKSFGNRNLQSDAGNFPGNFPATVCATSI